MLKQSLIAKTNGKCPDKQIVLGENYRISIITPSLFRIETGNKASFIDDATQSVWFRNIESVEFTQQIEKGVLTVTTDCVKLLFNTKNGKVKRIDLLKENRSATLKTKGNLKGTRRTLDMTFGAVKLSKGLVSLSGVSYFDDSLSIILSADGTLKERQAGVKDIYVFAYGYNYQSAIQDLYKLCGQVPLIPRYALGLWWSRYKAYTQTEYLELMQEFYDKNIPITVATVDMDWHWTDLNKQFGEKYPARIGVDNPVTGGWTGYSWNTHLFPDYRSFLKWLQDHNYKVTLNLHPKDGIRYFEDMYKDMAIAMGVDPNSKQTIEFDITDSRFINNYFDIVHKPYEKEGVDFWWIDWQQGTKSKIKNLDPLWVLNHYHFLDNAEDGRMPLILSRYAGIGSHRYPLGFSGDAVINWHVLNFQPYFTANATNVGYTWWSHDIGGHHFGYRDEELYLRWLQFGVFSPIMRLHSTCNEMLGKEPWRYRGDISVLAIDLLRLRHKLLPYLFTMNYRTHTQGLALCEPMYYKHPTEKEAYNVPNQYYFGTELIACPITKKANKKSGLAKVKVWLPKGRWTDILSGNIYNGDEVYEMYRDIASFPLFAKEGAIIPLTDANSNSVQNPTFIELLLTRGNGQFELYEDNSKTDYDEHKAFTKYQIKEDNNNITLIINPVEGDLSVLPLSRDYKLNFFDVIKMEKYTVRVDGVETQYNVDNTEYSNKNAVIELKDISAKSKVLVKIVKYSSLANKPIKEEVNDILSRWQFNTNIKRIRTKPIRKLDNSKSIRKALYKCMLPRCIKKAIIEVLDKHSNY